MKLKEVTYEHYLPSKRKTRRGNTVQGYESAISRHVIPRFGEYEMADITYREVQEWVDGFDKWGAALKAYKCLRQIIRWYKVKFRDRMDDPTFGVELVRKPTPDQAVFTREELRFFLRGIKGHPLEAVCICQLDLGLRKCEAFGLKWSDIDLTTGRVSIERGRHVVRGEVVDYEPKTKKSKRVLYLSAKAKRRLRRISVGGYLTDIRPDRGAQQLKKFCKENMLPWVPMKNFRHTWATLAIEDGMPIDEVARWLGHADLTMAYQRYVQLSPKKRRRVL